MRDSVFVRLTTLPCAIRGFTMQDENGDYNVYINDRLSAEMQKRIYKHELRHILRGDLQSTLDVGMLEFND